MKGYELIIPFLKTIEKIYIKIKNNINIARINITSIHLLVVGVIIFCLCITVMCSKSTSYYNDDRLFRFFIFLLISIVCYKVCFSQFIKGVTFVMDIQAENLYIKYYFLSCNFPFLLKKEILIPIDKFVKINYISDRNGDYFHIGYLKSNDPTLIFQNYNITKNCPEYLIEQIYLCISSINRDDLNIIEKIINIKPDVIINKKLKNLIGL